MSVTPRLRGQADVKMVLVAGGHQTRDTIKIKKVAICLIFYLKSVCCPSLASYI